MLRVLVASVFLLFYCALPFVIKKQLDWRATLGYLFSGFAVGLFVAAVLETAITEYYSPLISINIQNVMLGPIIEETLKFCTIMFWRNRKHTIRVLTGYNVGLGFGFQETLLKIYLGAGLFPEIFPLRTILTMPMHFSMASVSAFSIMKRVRTNQKRYYLLAGFAVIGHIIFNVVAQWVALTFQN
jgi:RsiW-degrading membrane proteinase PrsW (M82 family)